jgi:hypothetical protein
MILAAAAALLSAAAADKCIEPSITSVVGTAAFFAKFNIHSASYAAAEANLREGFRRACAKGLLSEPSIITQGAGPDGLLDLENAPDANVAAFSVDEQTERLTLEYPFVASDGTVNIPTAEVIEEAIYCAVRGATEEEQAETGRCLVD